MSLQGLKKALRQEMKQTLRQLELSPGDCHRQGTAIVDSAIKLVTEHLAGSTHHHLQQQQQQQQQQQYGPAAFACSIFLSMPANEVDTLPLLSRLFNNPEMSSSSFSGSSQITPEIYVPKLTRGDSEMSMVRLFSLGDLRQFPPDGWGIPAPPPTYSPAPSATPLPRPSLFDPPPHAAGLLDVIFLPGLAFDESCGRLGYGKGYYDRFVASCERAARERNRARPLLVGLCLKEQLLPAATRVPMGDFDRFVDFVVTEERTIQRDPREPVK